MSVHVRSWRTVFGFTLLAGLFAIPRDQAIAQAGTNVLLQSGMSSCGNPPTGAPSGTPTSQAWIETYGFGGCNLRGSAFSYLGVVGASARANWVTSDVSSGFINARASGQWAETVRPGMSARYLNQLDVRRLTLTFSIGATGNVSAQNGGTPGFGGSSSASINYAFQLGEARGTGGQTYDAPYDAPGYFSSYGEWGTVSRTIDIFAAALPNGTVAFNPLGFSMNGNAFAAVGKIFRPTGEIYDNSADANFGNTLVWGGVQSVQAFDGSGNVVTLGSDALFSLIGEQTGNDYVDASVEVITATPEPASGVLVALGLAALAVVRRRRRRYC